MDIKTPRPRLYGLDALRGICAIAIMFYHFYEWNGHDAFQIGYFGVYIFFILSGFSLWYSYTQQPTTSELLKSFFIARVARIAPLYILILLCMLSLRLIGANSGDVFSTTSLSGIFLNATFLFGWGLPVKTSLITGGWSIGIECVFYTVFPLLLLFARDVRKLLIGFIAAALLNQLYVGSLIRADGMRSYDYTIFPTFIVYFMLGVSAAAIYVRYSSRWLKMRGGVLQACLRLVIALCLYGIFFIQTPSPEAYLVGQHFAYLLLLSAVLILACASVSTSKPERALAKFLGDISYSTYLSHYLVYVVLDKLVPINAYQGAASYYLLPATVTLGVSYVLFRIYEMPMRAYINRKALVSQ